MMQLRLEVMEGGIPARLRPAGSAWDYERAKNKPTINGVELDGDKDAGALGFAKVATSGLYADLEGAPDFGSQAAEVIDENITTEEQALVVAGKVLEAVYGGEQ